MVRRVVLVLLCAFALVAVLPVTTSANHGAAHGGRDCEPVLFGEECFSGGSGQGGGGGHYEVDTAIFESSFTGGGGVGGGGGRLCFNSPLGTGCQAGGGGSGGN